MLVMNIHYMLVVYSQGIPWEIPSETPYIMTITITAHHNQCADDVILQSWFIAKEAWFSLMYYVIYSNKGNDSDAASS